MTFYCPIYKRKVHPLKDVIWQLSSTLIWYYYFILGFAGLYKKKVGTNLDGSALFYRADRFDLVEHKLFEYGSGSHVAIFAHFLPKSSDKDKSKSVSTFNRRVTDRILNFNGSALFRWNFNLIVCYYSKISILLILNGMRYDFSC